MRPPTALTGTINSAGHSRDMLSSALSSHALEYPPEPCFNVLLLVSSYIPILMDSSSSALSFDT
jgi:hypothetical protein